MTEWWTYRPEDFLLFSARAYWRLFELHNGALWPLPLAGPLLGALLLWLALRRPAGGRRPLAILAIIWALVGWSFVWNRYAAINWAAAWLAPLFAAQSLLLLGAAFSWRLPRRAPSAPVTAIGILLAGLAVFVYPVLAPLGGRPWSAAEIFGLAPDPTAIGTLGLVLLLAAPGWLLPIPLLWCLLAGATLWTMGAWEAFLPLAAAAIALIGASLPASAGTRSSRAP